MKRRKNIKRKRKRWVTFHKCGRFTKVFLWKYKEKIKKMMTIWAKMSSSKLRVLNVP